jgi:hypothetical protein
MSQRRIDPSELPLAKKCPSWLNGTPFTESVRPENLVPKIGILSKRALSPVIALPIDCLEFTSHNWIEPF